MYRSLGEAEVEGNLIVTALESLRLKIAGAEFVHPPRLDDEFLSRFLRLRRGNVEEALKCMQNYYQCIKNNKDYIGNERPSNFETALRSLSLAYLRNRSDGRRVVVVSYGNCDTTKLSLRDSRLAALFQMEYIAMEVEADDVGIVVIHDFAGLTFSHIKQLSYAEMKRATDMQGMTPLRICQIHACNLHPAASQFIKMGTLFLKPKLMDRVLMHNSNDFEEFHKAIDPKILPKSLGGKLEDAEAFDMPLIERILRENIYYEEFWNPEFAAKNPVEAENTQL